MINSSGNLQQNSNNMPMSHTICNGWQSIKGYTFIHNQRYGNGPSHSSKTSGPRSGTIFTSNAPHHIQRSCPHGRCPVQIGSPVPNLTMQSMSFATLLANDLPCSFVQSDTPRVKYPGTNSPPKSQRSLVH